MIKKVFLTLIVVFFVIVTVGLSVAQDKGNGRKGKYLFRKSCRSCHIDGGTAKELSPVSKTQADWVEAFSKDKYQSFDCAVEWEKRSDKDLLDIFTYMHDHAFDSPSPLKCK